jgi:signal transduction histidine kinase
MTPVPDRRRQQVGAYFRGQGGGGPATDPNQLESAILNLAINARDAMPAGGQLTIETSNVSVDHPRKVGPDELDASDYVLVSVSDTGSRMPPSVLEKAFAPFFITKLIGQGAGLGLSMVYGFVRQSDGGVGIDSAPGAGTTVKLYLPRLDGAAAPAQGEVRNQAAPRGAKACCSSRTIPRCAAWCAPPSRSSATRRSRR